MIKIGIICASDDELEPFLPHIEHRKITEKAMLKFYSGFIKGVEVVALYCGVCKVNAALATQILIDTYQVTSIVNAGVAGGMASNIKLFDTIVATEVAYHDVAEDVLTEFHPWMPSIYFKSDQSMVENAEELFKEEKTIFLGRMVTGEQFIKEENRDFINETYKPLSVDMETGSIAHVCYVNQTPFIAIRSITDTASHVGIENFEANCKKAAAIAKEITLRIIETITPLCKEPHKIQ